MIAITGDLCIVPAVQIKSILESVSFVSTLQPLQPLQPLPFTMGYSELRRCLFMRTQNEISRSFDHTSWELLRMLQLGLHKRSLHLSFNILTRKKNQSR